MTDVVPPRQPLRPFAVTLLSAAAFVALLELPIPGVPPDSPLHALSIGWLGLTPILEGFIAVELVAVAIRRLRPMRESAEGRAGLRWLALALALLIGLYRTYQVLAVVRKFDRFESSSVFSHSVSARLLFAVFLPLGLVTMMALARVIDTVGMGAGYSILIATRAAFGLVRQGFYAVQQVPTELLLRFLLPVGFLAVVAWKMLSWPAYAGSRARYRLPTPGLEPVDQGVVLAFAALQTKLARRFLWPLLPGALGHLWVYRATQVLAVLGLTALFSRLFHRSVTPQDRHALARATRASTLWLLALAVGAWVVQATEKAANLGGSHLYPLIAIVAVGMDLYAEGRGMRRMGRPRVLREFHRLEEADALAAVLGTAGIESVLRGAHHRALYQFFGPFIPVAVLVADNQFDRAKVVALGLERKQDAH